MPIEELPPVTETGETETVLRTGALIVKTAVALVVPIVAAIVEVVEETTALVEIENVPTVDPAGMVIALGTIAPERVDEREIWQPPAGAGPVSVTVPIGVEPPVTVEGDSVSEAGTGGTMVRTAEVTAPWALAVIVADTAAVAGVVEMENVAVVAP